MSRKRKATLSSSSKLDEDIGTDDKKKKKIKQKKETKAKRLRRISNKIDDDDDVVDLSSSSSSSSSTPPPSQKSANNLLPVDIYALPEVKRRQIGGFQVPLGQYYIDEAYMDFGVVLEIKRGGGAGDSLSLDFHDSVSYIIVEPRLIREVSAYYRALWDGCDEVKKSKKITLICDYGNETEEVIRSAFYIAHALFFGDDEKLALINQDIDSSSSTDDNISPDNNLLLNDVQQLYSLNMWIKIGEFGLKYINDQNPPKKWGEKFEDIICDYFLETVRVKNFSEDMLVEIYYSDLYPEIKTKAKQLIKAASSKNRMFKSKIKDKFVTSLNCKQEKLYQIINMIDEGGGDHDTKMEWKKDFFYLVNLDKLPDSWENILKARLNEKLPSGKTLSQFIYTTYQRYETLMRVPQSTIPTELVRFEWEYESWKNTLDIINNRLYENLVKKEETDKLFTWVPI